MTSTSVSPFQPLRPFDPLTRPPSHPIRYARTIRRRYAVCVLMCLYPTEACSCDELDLFRMHLHLRSLHSCLCSSARFHVVTQSSLSPISFTPLCPHHPDRCFGLALPTSFPSSQRPSANPTLIALSGEPSLRCPPLSHSISSFLPPLAPPKPRSAGVQNVTSAGPPPARRPPAASLPPRLILIDVLANEPISASTSISRPIASTTTAPRRPALPSRTNYTTSHVEYPSRTSPRESDERQLGICT